MVGDRAEASALCILCAVERKARRLVWLGSCTTGGVAAADDIRKQSKNKSITPREQRMQQKGTALTQRKDPVSQFTLCTRAAARSWQQQARDTRPIRYTAAPARGPSPSAIAMVSLRNGGNAISREKVRPKAPSDVQQSIIVGKSVFTLLLNCSSSAQT